MHDILDADRCKIVHDDFTKVLCCADYCKAEKQINFIISKNRHEEFLASFVRYVVPLTKELGSLVVSSQKEYDWSELCVQLQISIRGQIDRIFIDHK